MQSQDFHGFHGNQTRTKQVELKIDGTLVMNCSCVGTKLFVSIMRLD